MFHLGSVTLGQGPRVAAVVVSPEDVSALPDAGAPGPDLFEIRLDMFPDRRPEIVGPVFETLRRTGRGILLTVRSPGEGGENGLDERERLSLYRQWLDRAEGIDVEVASGTLWAKLAPLCRNTGKLLVGSFHDFGKTPAIDWLEEKAGICRQRGGDLFKAACTATGPEDVVRMLDFVVRNQDPGVIGLSMGPWGRLARVAAPVLGGLLSYGFLSRPSAPGQVAWDELAAAIRSFSPTVVEAGRNDPF